MLELRAGEVVSTEESHVNKDLETNSIQVRLVNHSTDTLITAKPLNPNMRYVPVQGELVLLVKAPSDITKNAKKSYRYYYIDVININNSPNNQSLFRSGQITSQEPSNISKYDSASNGLTRSTVPDRESMGKTFESNTINPVQSFEGDYLIVGRQGQSIRLGSSIKPGGNYSESPKWNGKSGSPITIISNGKQTVPGQKFIVEDFNKDPSTLILTSDQIVDFKPSQTNFGVGVKPSSTFKGSQILGTADRIVLNSKTDNVIVSGKKSVNILTPDWATDMNELANIVEELIQHLADLTSGKATFATGVGPTGPATNSPQLSQLLVKMKRMKQ